MDITSERNKKEPLKSNIEEVIENIKLRNTIKRR